VNAVFDDKAAIAELERIAPKLASPNSDPRAFSEEVTRLVEKIKKRIE
jgi:hypothetical protein